MKNKLLLLLLLLAAWGARAQTVIQSQSFEPGEAVNYTSNTFNYNTIGGTTAQNGNQYFQRVTETTATATIPSTFWPLIPVSGGALNGSYFWAAEATQGRSNTPIRDPGYVALNSVSVAGYTNLQVKVAFLDPRGATNTFLNKDTLKVQVRLNNTGPWVLLGQFISDNPNNGGNLRQDLNLNGVYDAADAGGSTLNATMTDYTFSVGSSASTMVTRVVSSSQSLSSEIGFDNIRVLGTAASSQAPVLAGIETTNLAYNEGDAATQITNALTVSDPDNTTAAGATVKFTAGYDNSEDRLVFINQPGITGSFNTSTGVLTLSGTASLAAYQAALRSVQYQDVDAADASAAMRTVAFAVTDPAGVTSSPVTRSITVTTHLDAASSLNYTEDFESEGEGTRYASNHFFTSVGIQFQRTTSNPADAAGGQPTTFSNLSGAAYWFGENTASPVNPAAVDNGVLTTKQLNASGFRNLHFQIRLGASVPNGLNNGSGASWVNTHTFQLFYRVAGSSTWTAFGLFRGTGTTPTDYGAIRQDTNPTGTGVPTGPQLTTALQNFDFALPTALDGQTVEFQLVLTNLDAYNDFAFDLIQVTGTQATAPTVTTAAASSLTSTSAVLGGNATADGGAAITDRGVVYSLSSANATPTIGGTGVTKDANGMGTGSFAKTITGLAAGTTYAVRAYATNSVGISYGSVVTFATAAALSTTGSQTNVSCNGGTNGTATVMVSGGVPPYTYAWTTSPAQTTATATGLSAGTYTVTVTDASGATTSRSFTITQPAALTAATSQTTIACNGSSTGAASVTPGGGTSPYSYSWSPNVSTTSSATNLAAGTYTVTVTDANGCTISRTVTITQPAALTATTSQNNVTTNGGTNGSATLMVSGGTPNYTYSWSPSVSTTATASNLSAGTYTVTATDANGCTIARTFTITQPAAATAAPVVTAPANSSLIATATPTYSGTAPAGSVVTVYVDGVSIGTTTAPGGTFSLTQPTALAQGSHAVYATAQLSGQTVSANGNTNTFTVDTVAPTATLTTTAGSATSTSPIPFSVSFSETITGFSASGITVTNGTVTSSAVSGSGPYTFTVTPTANGTVTVSIRANAAQDAAGNGNAASAAVSVTYTAPITATTWTGTISTDWFTAGNWSAGVPTATIDATISASAVFFPTIASGTATTRNLTLNNGATLNMSGGTLDVRANLTSNGTANLTGGTVVLGTTAVSNGPNILGSSRIRFWNLTVNSNGVLLSTSAGASVRRLLSLSGAFVTQANPFVLESDATGTAMVVNVNSAGFVFGSATVQRYIDASGNTGTSGYRHYSAPVSGATVSSLSTSAYGGSFTAQVNQAYNTSDPNQLTLATYPNVFSYDESKIAGSPAVSFSDFDKGYQSPASLSDPLTVGRGYAVQMGNAEKVQFTGSLNNNTQTITNITYAAAGTPGAASAGWALIGNPYPAPLDWHTVGTATGSGLNGVDGAAYVFQSTSAYSGRYTSFINNVGAGTGLIASGQGFFVHATTPGTTGSVTLTNANRLTSYASPAFQRTTAETRPLLHLSLGNQAAPNAAAQDEAFIYFEAGATDAFDGQYDAYKLANPSGYYLGTVTPGSAPVGLSVDGRAPLTTTTEIPLWVSLPAGTYTLTATELLNFATLAGGTTVQLRDAALGTLTDLAATPSYRFTVAANAASAGRFSLVFRPSSALATLPSAALAAAQASLYPNPATAATTLSVSGLPQAVTGLRVEVLDVLGRAVAHYTLPVHTGSTRLLFATDQLASTLYLLRLTALDAQGQVQGTLPTQRLTLSR